MKTTSIILLMMSLPIVVCAEERGQSILFQDKTNEFEHLTTKPKEVGKSQGDQCMELTRQIDQLKGKPQRRHALMQRYQLECQQPEIKTTPAFK